VAFTSYVTKMPKGTGLVRTGSRRAKRKKTMAKKRNMSRYHRKSRTAQLARELSGGGTKKRRKKVAKKRSKKKSSKKRSSKKRSKSTASKSRRRPRPGSKARAKVCKAARKKKRASSVARSLAKKKGSKKSKSRAGRALAMTRWCRNFNNLELSESEIDDE
jgi:hypothetical protein